MQASAPLAAQLNADSSLATMLSLHMPTLNLEAQVWGCGLEGRWVNEFTHGWVNNAWRDD